MQNLSNNLFLLIANLSQQKNKQNIINLFIQGLNSFLTPVQFSWSDIPNKDAHITVSTRKNYYGELKFSDELFSKQQDNLTLVQNAAQMLAVIIERLEQEELLNNQNKHLEKLVDERTLELKKQNDEYASLNSELIKTANALAENEARFRAAFDSTQDCILIWDKEYNYVYANNAAILHVGTTPDKVMGKNIRDALGHIPDFMKLWMSRIDKVFKTSKNLKVSDTSIMNGRTIYTHSILSPIFDNKNKVFAVCVVYRDITDIRMAEEELKIKNKELFLSNKELIKAKEKAEESDRLKSTFLANLSHEIRTPMNGIMGFTSLLRNPDLSSKNKLKYIEIVHSSGKYLLSIINDIIEISRLETRQVSANIEEVNLNSIFDELYSELSITIPPGKKLKLINKSTLPENNSSIKTDAIKLKQILINLISNSIKYTIAGTISFGCELINKKDIQFFVKDTGIGIRKDQYDLIFDRFRQGDTHQIFQSGSGLGLSITKSYVELLGGKIWLESEVEKGSIFYFTIPYINYTPKVKKSDIKNKISNPPMHNIFKTILIVEDDLINYEYFKEIFSEFNVKLIHAKNGKEAVDECRINDKIDLVLMDIKMPVMDGFESRSLIKQFRPELKIFAQTAYAMRSDEIKIYNEGFDGYISKPVNREELIRLINL